jgi:hypothetical protein
MEKAITHLESELQKVRAGKANPVMLENVQVDYYGSRVPLSNTASINTQDSRTLIIQPWEKSMLTPIEKAIQQANLGFNPQNDGVIIRIVVPPLTEERRKELESDSRQKGSELSGAQNKLNVAQSNYVFADNDTTGRFSKAQVNSYREIRNNARQYRDNISNEKKQIDDRITAIESDRETAIKDEAAKIDKQISLSVTEKESLLDKINQMDKTKEVKRKGYENKVENYDGFAAHLEAMSILTSEKSAIFYSKWLITLLFILIEVAPVLFKLMTESGPYDDVLERIKHEVFIAEKLKISNLNDEVNTDLEISTNKNKNRMTAELKGNSELLNTIATKQADLAKIAIDKWYNDELEKLKANPDYSYAQGTTPPTNHS